MENLRRTKQLLIVLVALCLGCQLAGPRLALAATAGTGPQPGSESAGDAWTAQDGAAPLASLLARAQSAGSLLVLAELALPQPFIAEGTASAQAALTQRAAIVAASDAVLAGLKGSNAQVVATFTTVPYLAVRVDAAALALLASLPQVASVQEDVPAAPALASSTQAIGLPAVWASGVEGQGQTVVILDTGIDTDHPFFAGRLVDGACFSNAAGGGSQTPACPDGSVTQIGVAAAEADVANPACWNGAASLCNHGTHVAGIAAGRGADTFDGVARGAKIIAIQVFTRFTNYPNCGGSGTCMLSYTTDQIRALEYVYTTLRPAYSLAAVNMSLGSGQYTAACDYDGRKPAIDNLRAAGIATVIAAGNNNFRNGLTAPACISSAVAVGGVTDSDNAPADSVIFNLHSLVDLLAPAYSITSSVIGGYGVMNGTSMAAPHVAGAFALCKGVNPTLSVNQLEAILEQTGVAVRDGRAGGVYTKPRLKMDAAVAACQQVAVWTGAASSAWNNAANWRDGLLPGAAAFANVPAAPAGGRFPVISDGAELRGLLLEPGAQLSLANATVTLHGSLEALGAATVNTANSTLLLSGSQLATLALPAGQKLHHVQVGNGSDPFQLALEGNVALNGNLTVQPGATLDLAGAALTVEGSVVNRGALRQSLPVSTGVVEFLRIKNAAGSATRYWGVDITPAAGMGNTAVSVRGDQTCDTDGAGVRRCYEITPTTASPSAATFYYLPTEANGINNPAGYHWNGVVWEGPLEGSAGAANGVHFVTAQYVNAYSTFALRDGAPLAVLLASLTAEARPGHVLLAWETTSELHNQGFTLLRSQSPEAEPEVMAFVPSAAPGSTQGVSYSWQDLKVEPGNTYWYWLEDVDLAGVATRHGPVSVTYALRSP